MKDTTADFERKYTAMLMSRSGEERLLMGADMFDSAVRMMRAGIEASHGVLDEIEMRERLLERLYGDELSARARATIARRAGRTAGGRRRKRPSSGGPGAVGDPLR